MTEADISERIAAFREAYGPVLDDSWFNLPPDEAQQFMRNLAERADALLDALAADDAPTGDQWQTLARQATALKDRAEHTLAGMAER